MWRRAAVAVCACGVLTAAAPAASFASTASTRITGASAATFSATARPTISGTAAAGGTLTVTDGSWDPAATLTHQWYAGGLPIAGATGATVTLTNAQADLVVTVRTTGSAPGFTSATETSLPTGPVQGVLVPGAATIVGDAVVGHTLTVAEGTWAPTPTSFDYVWLADGQPIAGATGSTLTLSTPQVGAVITVQVTGHDVGYDGYADATGAPSAPTAPVVSSLGAEPSLNDFETAPVPTVAGTARVGATLSAAPGAWAPAADFSYQWLSDGQPIDGATAASLTVGAALVGHAVSVEVTGTRSGYVATARRSAPAVAVVRGRWRVTSAARTSGSTAVHGRLAAVSPGSSARADAVGYQWYVAGRRVRGATSRTFVCGRAYVGKRISVWVTATRAGYPALVSTSGASHPVGTFWRSAAPRIAAASVRAGRVVRATVNRASWAPSPTRFDYRWYLDGKPVAGATRSTFRVPTKYRGHRVSVRVTARKAGYPKQSQRFSAAVRIR